MKVAFAGQGKIDFTEKLKKTLVHVITCLLKNGENTFYFCDLKDEFENLSYCLAGELGQNLNIKRVRARAYYEFVSDDGEICDYKIEFTQDGVFNNDDDFRFLQIYLKPYNDVINLSDVLIVYYDKKYVSPPYAGHAAAFRVVKYAKLKRKKIINIFEML